MKQSKIPVRTIRRIEYERADVPQLIPGGLHVDSRGTVGFVNDFDLNGVDRMYWVKARQPNTPRGWVGHRRDHKWFWVVQGEVLIAVIKPDKWDSPSRDLPVQSHVLRSSMPQVLYVPPGYCTNSLDLTGNSILLICSSGKIESAGSDDFRFPADYWRVSAADVAA